MEIERERIKSELEECVKKSNWQKFEEYVGIFFIVVFLLILICMITYLFVTLIENPVSLAILCATILLLWMWWQK